MNLFSVVYSSFIGAIACQNRYVSFTMLLNESDMTKENMMILILVYVVVILVSGYVLSIQMALH